MVKKKTPEPPPKHPRDMTSDEAIAHLFHPEVVEHVKAHAGDEDEEPEVEGSE
jgi:hypothetical protein